jgi:ABC-2 type transport system permease protein
VTAFAPPDQLLSGGGPAGSLRRIGAISRRNAYVLIRSPHRFFDLTIWPLVDVMLFGSLAVFGAQSTGGAQRAAYLLSGVVLWHVVYQANIAVATGFLEETWTRNLLSLMVSPMREWEYVAGVALFGIVKTALGVGVVALTAVALYTFNVTSLGLGLLPVVVLLMLAGWALALCVIGLVLRFGTGAEALAWGMLFVLMPLSGVFYPVSSLPGFLQPIALALPTTHAFDAAHRLAVGGSVPWGTLGLAAVTTVLFGAAAVAFLLRMLRTFRARGFITRYT